MSVKTKSNLLTIGVVVIALLAGTVLLAGYANILPGGSGPQSKTCPSAGGTMCPMAKAVFAENTELTCAQKAGAGFDAKVCPMGRTEPCCAGDATESACGKTCPLDCTKPCCAGEAPAGCSPKACPPDCTKPCCAVEATTGCCPKPDASAAESCCRG